VTDQVLCGSDRVRRHVGESEAQRDEQLFVSRTQRDLFETRERNAIGARETERQLERLARGGEGYQIVTVCLELIPASAPFLARP
jgi:hypothetical protein